MFWCSCRHPSSIGTKFIRFLAFAAVLAIVVERGDATVPEQTAIKAFAETYDGWSCDEVLLDDKRRELFLDACRRIDKTGTEIAFCEALLRVRKQGRRLPVATKRDDRPIGDYEPIAEIAARRLQDEFDAHTDRLLVDPKVRSAFDHYCRKMLENPDTYVLRKCAIRLRKSRQLQPELVGRVNDWRREIREYPLGHLQAEIQALPQRPGVYLFRDKSGYLYIGQAQNLLVRLRDHLDQSDRHSLAQYLASDGRTAQVVIEVHIFGLGSPGEQLRMRRAYESDLIRSRKPRFNLAP